MRMSSAPAGFVIVPMTLDSDFAVCDVAATSLIHGGKRQAIDEPARHEFVLRMLGAAERPPRSFDRVGKTAFAMRRVTIFASLGERKPDERR
jgi:hypothetical protein